MFQRSKPTDCVCCRVRTMGIISRAWQEPLPRVKLFFGKFSFFKDFIYLFLDRGEGSEEERERNIRVWLPLMCSLLGTWSSTQARALAGNPTCDSLVCRPVLNPLRCTSHGTSTHQVFFKIDNALFVFRKTQFALSRTWK